jgi:hypothetical protein
MSKYKIVLDAGLISILGRSDFDNFTVLGLRDLYIASSSVSAISKVEARRFVYRNLLSLLNKGLLTRIDAEDKRKTKYLKTDKFHESIYASDDQSNSVNESDNQSRSDRGLLKKLTEKLQRYKSEMLSRVGESEEYKSLYSEFPQMKEMLQERYNRARDESSKLLGHVKALEALIEQQRLQTQ